MGHHAHGRRVIPSPFPVALNCGVINMWCLFGFLTHVFYQSFECKVVWPVRQYLDVYASRQCAAPFGDRCEYSHLA